MSQPIVQIYSTPTCHFCHLAKDYFTENHIAFEDFNVAVDAAKRSEMVTKSGQLGVPVILIGDEVIVGFEQDKIKGLLGL